MDRSSTTAILTTINIMRSTFQAVALLFWCTVSAAAEFAGSPVSSTNIFAPASTPARTIFGLSMFVLAVTGLIFVVVGGLLVYSVVKFRASAADAGREPAQVYGSTQIELAWTVIPVLIVVVLFLATARVIHAIQDAPKPATAVEVTVIGHQFWWEFRYPKLGIVTANELHIPVSDPAHPTPTFLKLLSADTDHSFWVPELGGKTDLIPNRVNEMWMDPPRPESISASARSIAERSTPRCSCACRWTGPRISPPGSRAQQQAAAQDDEARPASASSKPPPASTATRSAGHAANGRFGPDLTHLMSRGTIASGAAENTPANLRLWIKDPDAIKPGSLMPAMKLSDADLDAARAYLETLR